MSIDEETVKMEFGVINPSGTFISQCIYIV